MNKYDKPFYFGVTFAPTIYLWSPWQGVFPGALVSMGRVWWDDIGRWFTKSLRVFILTQLHLTVDRIKQPLFHSSFMRYDPFDACRRLEKSTPSEFKSQLSMFRQSTAPRSRGKPVPYQRSRTLDESAAGCDGPWSCRASQQWNHRCQINHFWLVASFRSSWFRLQHRNHQVPHGQWSVLSHWHWQHFLCWSHVYWWDLHAADAK